MRIATDFAVTSRPICVGRAFRPSQLFAAGDLGLWFDPSDIASLFQDSGGATPITAAGQSVARAADKSGGGLHASQATGSKRPIYGVAPASGLRQRLRGTDTLSPAYWTQSRVTVTPLGGGVVQIVPGTTNDLHSCNQQNFTVWNDSEVFTCSFEVKVTDPDVFRFVRFDVRTKALTFPGAYVDLTTGSVTPSNAPIAATAVPLDDGWWRVRVTANAGTGSGLSSFSITASTGNTYPSRTFASDGVAALLVRKPQAETGADLTAYQSATSQYEVIEAGVLSLPYLYRDGVDDELAATLPALSNATIAFASDQGVSVLTGQTIGAGAFDILRHQMLFGMIVIDRPLISHEAESTVNWLTIRAGAFA